MNATTTISTTTAAMMLVSCERAPDAVTIAVLGGLASTAKPPISPAATLPAPTPIRSRLKSIGRRPARARRPDRGRCLGDADEGHGEHRGRQTAELRPRSRREVHVGESAVDGADDRHAMVRRQAEGVDGRRWTGPGRPAPRGAGG